MKKSKTRVFIATDRCSSLKNILNVYFLVSKLKNNPLWFNHSCIRDVYCQLNCQSLSDTFCLLCLLTAVGYNCIINITTRTANSVSHLPSCSFTSKSRFNSPCKWCQIPSFFPETERSDRSALHINQI